MLDVHPLLLVVIALVLVVGAGRKGRRRRSRRARSTWPAVPSWIRRLFRRAPAHPGRLVCGVYLLSNPAFPGLIKVGFTRRHVGVRMDELSQATGVPRPFELVAFFPTRTPERDEALVHRALRAHRIGPKEFFEVDARYAAATCRRIVGEPAPAPALA